MKSSSRGQAILLAAALVVSAGCGGGGPPADPVDSEQARETLEAVLASWQAGESPADWRDRSPEVVVQDMDWLRGARLKRFELLGPGEAVDANLHCQVKLWLEDPGGGETERTVTYEVGTDPVLTVFRQVMP